MRRGWRLCGGLAGAGRAAIDPMAVPACLVAGHAPFAWGKDVHDAAHNAVVLEAVARMAYRTLTLKARRMW
jgi:L-ribulose-5-phosphate 4-epimerase